MTKIKEYIQLEDKVKYFKYGDSRIIFNVDDIFQKLEEFESTKDFIFRGCSEAKYKIYNSAQRHYITNELFRQVSPAEISNHYNSFISNLIDECKRWNSETAKKMLINNKVSEDNSLAYLSYMQHYGVPSPLLDFTFDPYIALFFAIDNLNYVPSDNEIDNYFSIYYTYQNAIIFESWKMVFKNSILNDKSGNIPYSEVSKNPMQLLLPDDEAYQIINNTNIINQKGLFFYNNDPFIPLEETYHNFAEDTKNHFGEAKFNKSLMLDKFVNCFNIHKSLIPYILDILKSKGITKDFIYPDTYKMKNAIIHNATKKILVTKK
jgi:FRG domain